MVWYAMHDDEFCEVPCFERLGVPEWRAWVIESTDAEGGEWKQVDEVDLPSDAIGTSEEDLCGSGESITWMDVAAEGGAKLVVIAGHGPHPYLFPEFWRAIRQEYRCTHKSAVCMVAVSGT